MSVLHFLKIRLRIGYDKNPVIEKYLGTKSGSYLHDLHNDLSYYRKSIITALFVLVVLGGTILYPGYSAFADTVGDLSEVFTDTGVPWLGQTAVTGFHGIFGAGLFNGERIIGNSRRRTVPLPIVLLAYQNWAYWSIGGGGVWIFQSDDHALKFGVGMKLHPGYRPDDDPVLIGMEKRKTSLDGYANVLWRTSLSDIGLRYYRDIADVSKGNAVSFRLSHNFPIRELGRLTPSIGIEWSDSRYVDYYYGVRPSEELPDRPSYFGRDTVNISVGITGSYRVSRSWSILAGLYGTRLGRGITDSPIVPRSFTVLAYFGAGWLF
jgi:outer membrane protein